MINAGVSISPFNGLQMWDDVAKQWIGITVRVNYPDDQTPVDNPVQVNDFLIEPNGNVWQVKNVEVDEATVGNFILDLLLTNKEPSDSIMPSLGSVSRGGIITPVNGYLAPYWDATVVSGEVSRIAAYMTMKNAGNFWSGDVPGIALEDPEPETPESDPVA